MTLSEKMTNLRKAYGLSQEDMAEKLNVSRQAISRWENGTALPDALNILQISKLFNVTTDYLLNDDYESDVDIPAVQSATLETANLFKNKKQLHLIAAICFTVSTFYWLVSAVNSTNDIRIGVSGFALVLCLVNAVAQFILYSKKQ